MAKATRHYGDAGPNEPEPDEPDETETPPPQSDPALSNQLDQLDSHCKEAGLPGLANVLAQLISERFGIRRP